MGFGWLGVNKGFALNSAGMERSKLTVEFVGQPNQIPIPRAQHFFEGQPQMIEMPL